MCLRAQGGEEQRYPRQAGAGYERIQHLEAAGHGQVSEKMRL